MLGLRCCAGFFSSCGKVGLLSSCGERASHCGGFSCYWAQALGHLGFHSCSSQALEHRLSSCGTPAWLLRGLWDLLDQWSNPHLLHWQVDSIPLSHQGSPPSCFLTRTNFKWKPVHHSCVWKAVLFAVNTVGHCRAVVPNLSGTRDQFCSEGWTQRDCFKVKQIASLRG